jgi:hypothetical protein
MIEEALLQQPEAIQKYLLKTLNQAILGWIIHWSWTLGLSW